MEPPVLIAGLGNPGSAYVGTYHNAGRDAVGRFASKRGAEFRRHGGGKMASIKEGILFLPESFMNNSGDPVSGLLREKKIAFSSLLVVMDDVYLPIGSVRIRKDGAAAGHNGLQSIIDELGTNAFPRLRVGVGPDPGGARRAEYVLSKPHPEAAGDYFEGLQKAVVALDSILRLGIDQAMNLLN